MTTTDPSAESAQSLEKRICVYEFGLLPPSTNARLVDDQMRLAHRYHNTLVEIDLARRARVVAALQAHPEAAELESQVRVAQATLEEALQSITTTRAAARGRAESAEQRARARELRTRLRDLRAQAKAARDRAANDPAVSAEMTAAEEEAGDRVRRARAACGVYWGTYLLHEAAMASSRQSGVAPKFQPWTGEGRVSVQLQGGLEVTDLWGNDTRIQILLPGERPGIRRRTGRNARLRLRVQSEHGKPVWAEWILVMHRALPDGARLKVATVSRRRRGTSWDWRLHLTADVSACPPVGHRAGGSATPDSAVALNLGFALRPDGGLRSGYLVGTDQWSQEVLAQKSDAYREGCMADRRWIVNGIGKADAIQAQRDLNMNAMRAALSTWIRAQAREEPEPEHSASAEPTAPGAAVLPAWFTERTTHLGSWRSPGRFAALAFAWQRGWFEGGDEGYDLLENWRSRDLHLERYETGLRTSAQRDRREGYRILAARMAERYQYLVIDNTDLRTFQKSPATDSDRTEIDAVKRQQRAAAGSELRAALLNAFGPRRVVKVSAVDVTRRHHTCGALRERDDASREWTCTQCGEMYDQDANACRNLLGEWRRANQSGESSRHPKDAETKPTRPQRMNAAKRAARDKALLATGTV